jgi:hypothetical protein
MNFKEEGSKPGPIEHYVEEDQEQIISRQIDLPVTAYHHHDVESISDASSIYRELTNDKLTPIGSTRSRPQLNRKLTGRTYPEGGLRAWSVVLGSFSGMMASFGFMATSRSIQFHTRTFY